MLAPTHSGRPNCRSLGAVLRRASNEGGRHLRRLKVEGRGISLLARLQITTRPMSNRLVCRESPCERLSIRSRTASDWLSSLGATLISGIGVAGDARGCKPSRRSMASSNPAPWARSVGRCSGGYSAVRVVTHIIMNAANAHAVMTRKGWLAPSAILTCEHYRAAGERHQTWGECC